MKNNQELKIGKTFVDFLVVLVKYRIFLIIFIAVITLGATVTALLLPKWYKSTVSVLPAERNDLLSTLTGLTSLTKSFGSSRAARGLSALTGGPTELDKYIAIVKSYTVTDEVIKKFKLREEYDMEDDYIEDVIKEWQKNLDLEIQEEGNLTITVYSKDRKKCAEIANYLVDRLNEINTQLSITNAQANREFIEKRYQQNLDDITQLETQMKEFQQKYGVIAIPEQLEATVKSLSEIYVQLYKTEVEYNVAKQNYGADHPIVKLAKANYEELKKKIDQLNQGTDNSQKDVKLLIPFKIAPKLGNEYLKIYRNLEIQYKILEFVQPLYEQAKVEEVRNTPSVLVLDKAVEPEKKAKPRIRIFFMIGLVASILVGIFIVFTKEMFNKLKLNDPETYEFLVGWLKFRRK